MKFLYYYDVIMMNTMAACLSISNINLSVSELDHVFHMHWFLGKNASYSLLAFCVYCFTYNK